VVLICQVKVGISSRRSNFPAHFKIANEYTIHVADYNFKISVTLSTCTPFCTRKMTVRLS
jgi:hypothetical protein